MWVRIFGVVVEVGVAKYAVWVRLGRPTKDGYDRAFWNSASLGWLRGPSTHFHFHSYRRGRCVSWNKFDGFHRRTWPAGTRGAL